MASRTREISSVQYVRVLPGPNVPTSIYPTPPPLSSHVHENNKVTSVKPRMTSENKQLTSQSLSEISHFEPGMQRLDMNHAILHLWIAYPDDLLGEEAAQACLRLLSEDERARWQAFKFDRHRREYLATHALVRNALSQHRAIPPESWSFQLNAYGKPAIEPECGLRFNLSNSLSLVVCLIAEGVEVGVDVESLGRAGSIAEVGPRMFSPRELAQLEGLHEDQRPGRCLRLWTLKEAYIKARGMGLALPLNEFSFVFDGDDRIHMEMDPSLGDKPESWRFCVVEYAGHCIATMVEGMSTPEVHLWESRPPFAAPQRLSLDGEIWFPRNY